MDKPAPRALPLTGSEGTLGEGGEGGGRGKGGGIVTLGGRGGDPRARPDRGRLEAGSDCFLVICSSCSRLRPSCYYDDAQYLSLPCRYFPNVLKDTCIL